MGAVESTLLGNGKEVLAERIEYNPCLNPSDILSKVLGIISYFPPNPEIREVRKNRCFNLLKYLKNNFNLPIIIVSQCWSSDDIQQAKDIIDNLTIYQYTTGLTVVGARAELRDKFLSDFNYDYIILLDDDSEIKATKAGIRNYLKEIDSNPNKYILFNHNFSRLSAISRECYQLLSYDFIREAAPIWEDYVHANVFSSQWIDKMRRFSGFEIDECSLYSENDPFSVYWRPEYNYDFIARKSLNLTFLWADKLEKAK